MRLIDADALLKAIIGYPYGYRGMAESDIENQTTVDAVPIIRCKDCKHYYVLNEFRGNCSEYNFVEKIPCDYCSWAERKEE